MVRTLGGHTALSRIRRTKLETYPIIAGLTLGHLELGPYSGDGEEDERDDLCEEHGGRGEIRGAGNDGEG